jgi:hypothetical protein
VRKLLVAVAVDAIAARVTAWAVRGTFMVADFKVAVCLRMRAKAN